MKVEVMRLTMEVKVVMWEQQKSTTPPRTSKALDQRGGAIEMEMGVAESGGKGAARPHCCRGRMTWKVGVDGVDGLLLLLLEGAWTRGARDGLVSGIGLEQVGRRSGLRRNKYR